MNVNGIFVKLKSNKAFIVTVLLASVGIILILISGSRDKSCVSNTEQINFDFDKYESTLEKRLEEKINKIDGVSSCDVILLIETSYIHDAKNGSSYSDLFGTGSESDRISESAPKIRGVAVICVGGGEARVKKDITDMLSALLGIPTNKIWVGSK